MTNEEALKVIIESLAVAIHDWDDPTDEYQREQAEGFQKAKEALEKQIPKKVIWKHSGVDPLPLPYCGACNRLVIKSDYCDKCGQALDWGKGK